MTGLQSECLELMTLKRIPLPSIQYSWWK